MAGVIQTASVTARVPADLVERVEAVARQEDRSVSSVVRQALVAYVQRSEQDAA